MSGIELKCATRAAAALMIVCQFIGGCGPSGRSPLGTVTGAVEYNGEPLDDAMIVFHNPDGRSATGRIIAGKIQDVTTYDRPGDGAPIGTLVVTIHPNLEAGGLQLPKPGQSPPKASKPRFPARYSDAQQSALKAEIRKGANELSFELSD